MNAAFLTVIFAIAASQPQVPYAEPMGGPAPACRPDPNEQICGTDLMEGCVHSAVGSVLAWFAPMPQTCYSPRFGCYPGNSRDINRYPAFHGSYYRRAYNYRQLFEYPWHAAPHEPKSLCVQPCAAEVPYPSGEEQTPFLDEVNPVEPIPAAPPIPAPSTTTY